MLLLTIFKDFTVRLDFFCLNTKDTHQILLVRNFYVRKVTNHFDCASSFRTSFTFGLYLVIFLFQIDRLMELYFKYQRRVQDADVKIERELEVSFTVCLYVQTSPKEKLIHFL